MGIGLGNEPKNKDLKDRMSLLDSFDLSLDSNGNSKNDMGFSFEDLDEKGKEEFERAQEFINDAIVKESGFKQTLESNNKGLLGMIGKALGIEQQIIPQEQERADKDLNKDNEDKGMEI